MDLYALPPSARLRKKSKTSLKEGDRESWSLWAHQLNHKPHAFWYVADVEGRSGASRYLIVFFEMPLASCPLLATARRLAVDSRLPKGVEAGRSGLPEDPPRAEWPAESRMLAPKARVTTAESANKELLTAVRPSLFWLSSHNAGSEKREETRRPIQTGCIYRVGCRLRTPADDSRLRQNRSIDRIQRQLIL